MKPILIFLLLVGSILAQKQSYNVLIMMPFSGWSHKNVFNSIAKGLTEKGHKVTIVSPFEDKGPTSKGITNIILTGPANMRNDLETQNLTFFHGSSNPNSFIFKLLDLACKLCDEVYKFPEIQDIIKRPRDSNNKPRFDLLIVDEVFNDWTLALGHHMGIPSMYISPSNHFAPALWNLNVPNPLSYVPSPMLQLSEKTGMTFFERAINVFSTIAFTLLRNLILYRKLDPIIQSHMPNSPPLLEMESKVSFLMSNTHPSFFPVAPSMPYMAEIGCIHCKPAKPLPKDLEAFMQSSGDDGVIYFSLGSVTEGKQMPIEMRQKLMDAFKRLPQKVLFKFEEEIEDLPKNVQTTKWVPQTDLLAHPKLRLFITHGGGLSLQEALYNGCPLLGFPLSADQWGNMGNALRLGFGDMLDWQTFTSDDLYNKIIKIITNKSYKETASHLSVLLKDQPEPPIDRAVYWIEYVIRHKGAPHLKADAGSLNFIQYFLLDVIGAALLILLVILGALILVVKISVKLIFRLFKKKSTKKFKKN